jgi:hypothetical protein
MPDWKGLFKKGTDLARQAAEERGLFGQTPQERRDTSTRRSPADEVAAVVGPGHPHPYELLMTDDVARIMGVSLDHVRGPSANIVDECAGPTWQVWTGNGNVSVNLLVYAHHVDPEELLGYTEQGVQPLAGVGDKAAIAPEMVGVSQGGEVVTVHFADGPATDRRAQLEAFAQTIAERLPK